MRPAWGNRSPFPVCLRTLGEKKEIGLLQFWMASTDSSFHHVYSNCFVFSREPMNQGEGRKGLRKSEHQYVCWKPLVTQGSSSRTQVRGLRERHKYLENTWKVGKYLEKRVKARTTQGKRWGGQVQVGGLGQKWQSHHRVLSRPGGFRWETK